MEKSSASPAARVVHPEPFNSLINTIDGLIETMQESIDIVKQACADAGLPYPPPEVVGNLRVYPGGKQRKRGDRKL